MRRIVVICLMLAVPTASLAAETESSQSEAPRLKVGIIHEGVVTGDGYAPQWAVPMSYQLKEVPWLKVTGFVLVLQGWGQGRVGAEFQLASWASFGASVGMRQDTELHKMWQTGYKLKLNPGDFSWTTFVEIGGGDPWWLSHAEYKVMSWLKIGAFYRRTTGMGPHAIATIPVLDGLKFQVFARWVPWNPEQQDEPVWERTQVGVGLKFAH